MRNYEPLLELADDLEGYNGYLSTAMQQQRNNLRTKFDQKRRELVYDVIRDEPNASAAWASVTADLDRIEASGDHSYGGLHFVREELEKHIVKQAGNGALMRFATRWTLPAVSAIAAIVYFYLQLNR